MSTPLGLGPVKARCEKPAEAGSEETAGLPALKGRPNNPLGKFVTAEQILLMPVSFQGPDEKAQAYSKVVEAARENNAMAIATLNDAHYSRDTGKESVEAYYPGKLAAERDRRVRAGLKISKIAD